jgi:hypothetical protein
MRKSILMFPLAFCFINPAFAVNNDVDTGPEEKTVSEQPEGSSWADFLKVDEIQRSRALTRFGTGYYFGLGSTYDGSDLLINEPSLHKDLGLLEQNRYMDAHIGKIGDTGARVQISGNIEIASAFHSHPLPNKEKSAVDAFGEVDLSTQVNDYFTGYIKFAGSSDNEDFVFDQGFLVFGNLDEMPWYVTAGKLFVPNGDYSTYMVSSPLTRALGRNKANAVVGGYFDPNFSAEAFAWQGFTKNSSSSEIDQWGVNADFHPLPCPGDDRSFRVGASYFNHMGDADGIITTLGEGSRLDHYVDAVNVNSKVGLGDFGFRGEYITALRTFDAADLHSTEDAKPSAMNLEAAYTIPGLPKKTRVIAGYGRTWDAEQFALAEQQYGVSGSVTVLRNTIISAELLKKEPYEGETDYVGTVQVDLYF